MRSRLLSTLFVASISWAQNTAPVPEPETSRSRSISTTSWWNAPRSLQKRAMLRRCRTY